MSGQPLRSEDVAREAGVSRATVSYVLNGRLDVRVSDATRQHVLEVAQRLGYVGSPAARALRTGRGDVVLLLIPDWDITSQLELLLDEIGQLVAQRGLVCLRFEGPHWQNSLDRLLARVSAACVVSFDPLNERDTHVLAAAGIPEVRAWLLDSPRGQHTTNIRQDGVVLAQVDHLLAEGYTELAYLATAEPRSAPFMDARIRAFHEICGARGMADAPSAVVAPALPDIEAQLRRWLTKSASPLGIAAWNDFTALGILGAAGPLGLTVPDELGVIGIDDTPVAVLTTPQLSSVRFDLPSEAAAVAHRVSLELGLDSDFTPTGSPPVLAIPRASTRFR